MTQGKQDLKQYAGSFQTADQQRDMMKAVEKRHESFADVVQRQNQGAVASKGRRSTRESEMVEPESGGVSLTQDEITGGLTGGSTVPPASEHFQQESNEDESHESVNEFGDTVCKYCGSVIRTEKPDGFLDIKDDELTTYMFGGRIIREFKVGNVEFSIQSLLQNEVDDVSFRTGQDMENGAVSLESDYRTRHSLYRLVYSLDTIQGSKIIADPPKGATSDNLSKWFEDKFKIISSYSHQFAVMLSEKQAILENSISYSINDQVRLKN